MTTLSKELDRSKFDVSVLCLNEMGPLAEELKADGIPVYLLPSRRRPDYFAFAKARTHFREHRPHVVHTHNTQPFIDGGLGAVLARVPRLIHTDHARDFPDKKRYMLAERVLSRFAYRVVGVSDHTGTNLIRFVKIDPAKITTVYNGIEPEKAPAVDVAEKRRELGIPAKALVLGVGVRLTEQKGLRYLLAAMPEVSARVPEAHLAIAGYGPLADELQAAARDLGVSGCTHFLGPRQDMPEVLQVFDIYVLPSVWEGFPMIILEAMAAGLPIVATRVGGVPEAVEHGQTGLLVEPRRPDRLAEALSHLLTDPESRRRFGTAARGRFQERYTAAAMARAYEELYLGDR